MINLVYGQENMAAEFGHIAKEIQTKFWPMAMKFAGNMAEKGHDRLFRVDCLTLEVTRSGDKFYLQFSDVGDDDTSVCFCFDKPRSWSDEANNFIPQSLMGDETKCLELARRLAVVVDQMRKVDYGNPNKFI